MGAKLRTALFKVAEKSSGFWPDRGQRVLLSGLLQRGGQVLGAVDAPTSHRHDLVASPQRMTCSVRTGSKSSFCSTLLDFSLSSLGLPASLRKWIYLDTNHFLSEACRPSDSPKKVKYTSTKTRNLKM